MTFILEYILLQEEHDNYPTNAIALAANQFSLNNVLDYIFSCIKGLYNNTLACLELFMVMEVSALSTVYNMVLFIFPDRGCDYIKVKPIIDGITQNIFECIMDTFPPKIAGKRILSSQFVIETVRGMVTNILLFNTRTFNGDFSRKHIRQLLKRMEVTPDFWDEDSPNNILEVYKVQGKICGTVKKILWSKLCICDCLNVIL